MKNIAVFSILLGLPLLISSSLANAATSAAAAGETIVNQGNAKGALACMTCHGKQGQGNAAAGYPYLAGQPQGYLVKQLQDFASERRKNSVMQPFASALSADEMNAVASYYAKLPLPKTASSTNNNPSRENGKRLATKGKWSVGVPACFQCHGDQGQGVAPNFPAIRGQSATYLKKQLEHWRKGERSNDPVGLMQAVVAELEEAEITAVASYLASQIPQTMK